MKIIIIGGDKRYLTLFETLCKHYDTTHIKTQQELENINLSEYEIIVLPITGVSNNNTIVSLNDKIELKKEFFENINSKAIIYTGLINSNLDELFPNNSIQSFLTDEDVKKENNLLTVQGILEEINTVNPEKICILGYGNIGKLLYQKLKEKNMQVVVGVIEQKDFKELKGNSFYTSSNQDMTKFLNTCDYIVNTVPENIIKLNHVINSNSIILDIASYPHGMSDSEKELIPNYKRYLGIPAKKSPEQAGKVLYKKLKKDLKGGLK